MYKAILVALDGSEFRERALPIACEIARQAGATLHLAHVHTPYHPIYVEGIPVVDNQLHPLHREHERAYLAHVCNALKMEDKELEICCVLLEGEPAQALAAYAAKHDLDLLVMTARGRGGLTRAWLGSVADALARCSPVPVLLVRCEEEVAKSVPPLSFRSILISLDGSPASEQILEPALALGKVVRATYHLLKVVHDGTPPSLFIGPGARPIPADLIKEQQRAAQRYLAGIAQRLADQGHAVTTTARVDKDPTRAILAQAQETHSGAIAMATHGYRGLQRLVLGSVADKVVRTAEHPILLYVSRPEDAEARRVVGTSSTKNPN